MPLWNLSTLPGPPANALARLRFASFADLTVPEDLPELATDEEDRLITVATMHGAAAVHNPGMGALF